MKTHNWKIRLLNKKILIKENFDMMKKISELREEERVRIAERQLMDRLPRAVKQGQAERKRSECRTVQKPPQPSQKSAFHKYEGGPARNPERTCREEAKREERCWDFQPSLRCEEKFPSLHELYRGMEPKRKPKTPELQQFGGSVNKFDELSRLREERFRDNCRLTVKVDTRMVKQEELSEESEGNFRSFK